MRKTHHVPTE